MRFFSKMLFVLVWVIGFSTFVNADPIRITSGAVNNGSINIIGSGINYSLNSNTSVFSFGTPYQPGSNIKPTINAFTSDGLSGTTVYQGGATINGVNYFGQFGGGFAPLGSSNMIFSLSEGISLPTAFPPLIPGLPNTVFSVNVPFTMTGYLSGRNCPAIGPCVDIPRQDIYGNGTATLNFSEFNGTYRLNTYNYTFSSTPEPTPEPATLILMGTGLAGIFGYATKRRKKKTQI